MPKHCQLILTLYLWFFSFSQEGVVVDGGSNVFATLTLLWVFPIESGWALVTIAILEAWLETGEACIPVCQSGGTVWGNETNVHDIGVASILQTGYSVYLAEGRLEATESPAWRWRGRGGGSSFIAVCGECLLFFLRNLWTDSFKENIQKVRNAVWLWYWVLVQVGASSYELQLHKGLNLWGEDHVELCSSVWRKEWFLKSQRCWGLTGFKDFPGLKINVKASIVLNKFMKKGHLGYLGVGYVSR